MVSQSVSLLMPVYWRDSKNPIIPKPKIMTITNPTTLWKVGGTASSPGEKESGGKYEGGLVLGAGIDLGIAPCLPPSLLLGHGSARGCQP